MPLSLSYQKSVHVRTLSVPQAMELILTGRTITAQEAFMWGVVSRVLPDDQVFDFAIESAKLIASYSRPVILMAKESVNAGRCMDRPFHG